MRCATHPDVETSLSCGKCGRPICPKCLVQTPVGARCKECASLKRLPTYDVSTSHYMRAAGAGVGIALVCGFGWWALNLVLPFFLLRLVVAAGVGYAIGEVISLSVNRKRGIGLAIVSGLSATLSFAVGNVFFARVAGLPYILLSLLILAVVVVMAVNRFR